MVCCVLCEVILVEITIFCYIQYVEIWVKLPFQSEKSIL
jgi:hypothetical protein